MTLNVHASAKRMHALFEFKKGLAFNVTAYHGVQKLPKISQNYRKLPKYTLVAPL